MNEKTSSNVSVSVVCPVCHRQLAVNVGRLGEDDAPKCQYCGAALVFSSGAPGQAGTGSETIEIEEYHDSYTVGSARKRWAFLRPVWMLIQVGVLAAIMATAIFVGGGRIQDTYFVAIKKKPGLSHYYVTGTLDTVYGQYFIDKQIARNFDFILLKYNKQIGLVFFRAL